jgi:putative ABC transport system permease protein
VEQLVHTLAPGLPLVDVHSMEQSLQGVKGFFLFHLGISLTGVLGIIGLVLATVGVYSVTSYVAAQRTHEIGIRMALGANRNDILKLVLGRGCVLVSAGVLAGLALTLLAARGLAGFMVGVGPADPLTLFAASLFLAVVGLIASFIPARRAMKVEPLRALKYE